MKSYSSAILSLVVVVAFGSSGVLAASEWAQCGGTNYVGDTTCDDGLVCWEFSEWYSQCLAADSPYVTSDIFTSTVVSESGGSCSATNTVSNVPTTSASVATSSFVLLVASSSSIPVVSTSPVVTTSTAFSSTVILSSVSSSSAPSVITSSAVTVSSITSTIISSSKTLVASTTTSSFITSTSSSVTSISASPSTSTVSTTTLSVAASTATGTCSSDRTKFAYFGVNESGAEFGTNIPGTLGTDYVWPVDSSIDYFVDEGFNFFRVPFLAERLAPVSTGLTGTFDPTYLGDLQTLVTYITGKGAHVAIEPHNYMRYNGDIISSTSDFQTFWTNLASEFADNDNAIFDLMNEPYGIDASVVFELMQAGLDGVRAAGATSQLVLVEGTSYTGAWTWTTSGNSEYFSGISDPNDNVAIEMHQYLDSDGSGTSATCVSSTVGAERLADATAWLQSTGMKGFLGEIGAGSNADCIAAVYGAMCATQEAGGVWIGASWWAAGPWWGSYFTSIEPPSGAAVADILPQALLPFL